MRSSLAPAASGPDKCRSRYGGLGKAYVLQLRAGSNAVVKLPLHPNPTMRWLFSFLVLALLGAVQALSSSGTRLLVILEEESERENYSVFLEDLSSKCFALCIIFKNQDAAIRWT